ncbi:hypothetical protein MKX01_041446 [Papaver californicum]|nr:hypothetical protein MKX01_041446 [Papaver californicum]
MAKNSFILSQFGYLFVVVLIVMTNYYGVVADGRQVCDGNILGHVFTSNDCRRCVPRCSEQFNDVVRSDCFFYGFNQYQCFCCGPVTTHGSLETS